MDNINHIPDINAVPDFVWEALQDASLRQSDEFRAWIAESEENLALFNDLSDCKEAGSRLLPEMNPDMELQWKRIQEKRKPVRTLNRWKIGFLSAGIAASLALLCLWGFHYLNRSESSALSEQAQVEIADIPLKEDADIIVKAVKKDQPVLLAVSGSAPAPVYENVLDYTSQPQAQSAFDEPEVVVEELVLTTPRGRSIRLLLSDGTEVWLNAESRLTYPSLFTEATRTVELEGEAFFKVAHDSEHPFMVKHHGMITQALGTSFNIRSYENEKKHVTLVEGSVRVQDEQCSQQQILSPGEDVTYDTSQAMTVRQVNTEEYTAWTDGMFYFEQTELQDIMRILGRWYNVTIAFVDEPSKHFHFTFWAERGGSLKQALGLLNQMGTVKAYLSTDGNQVVIKKR